MINKIKAFFAKRQQDKKQKAELKKAQAYYQELQRGGAFVRFVQADLKNSATQMNRQTRRRLQKTVLKGEFNRELIEHYQAQIERVLANIDLQLNPPKPEVSGTVDGAKMYADMKKAEKK